MNNTALVNLQDGMRTAFIDSEAVSNVAYRPTFISNVPSEGKKVLSTVEDELLNCDRFDISVAFITMSGVTPLLQTLKELEKKNIPGRILTTNYLNFSEPKALSRLNELKNITVKMYDIGAEDAGFHTKGYIFKREELYRIIIGSSNMTNAALTQNKEWNTRIISTESGEMAQEIVKEFNDFWKSDRALDYDDFIETYSKAYKIIKKQRELAKEDAIVSIEKYKLKPNSMQLGFIDNLSKIVNTGEDRALLISATGTGKTYASAFAMRELSFKRVLFVVHRATLARQAMASFRMVFGDKEKMGIVGAGNSDYDADFVFAMVETLHKEENLSRYERGHFDCIILDEAHHSTAGTYRRIMEYFKPKLFLGMTATPDKREGNSESNVYELFNYQIAYEIRLKQAMEENLLCPFHYFGISDITTLTEKEILSDRLSEKDFSNLTSDERVKHVIEQAEYYGFSGDRVKGLIFCSRKRECEELSKKFNQKGFRTIALSGDDDEKVRQQAFERLAMDEEDATDEVKPLDYIFSVDILNEGVDIIEVNQVIMLRPTQSPIVFIQQLGRGLRKAKGKEYVVILDFIGNYTNNFMIPIALSGDRTYNADNIRKYVISGNNIIPGASTIHFDEISRNRIFDSIDHIRGMKSIIKESYVTLKNRLGRVPNLYDFYMQGEVDPLVIIKEYKTYWRFLAAMEKDNLCCLTEHEKLILEYLSKTVLSGVRPCELLILKELLDKEKISAADVKRKLLSEYGYAATEASIVKATEVLLGEFTSNEAEYRRFGAIDILRMDKEGMIRRLSSYAACIRSKEFSEEVKDIIRVGLARYKDKYVSSGKDLTPFVLNEKYSRRDVSLLMDCGRDLSSTMYGKYRKGDDVFIFVTYHKNLSDDVTKQYAEGKPDYADAFSDNVIFKWDSQIGKGPDSSYMKDVTEPKRRHLFIKKSDAETSFYYMGTFDVTEVLADKKKDNSGKLQDISKVTMRMHHPVRDDLLKYLESSVEGGETNENSKSSGGRH